jgi:parallel beta-helix repeat protein
MPLVEPLEPRRLFSTYTVMPTGGGNYTDLETAIVDAPAGSTLLVSPGTYTAHTTDINGTASVFWINKALTIVSTGGPSVTTLVAPAGQVQCLLISSSNVTVQGFSLHGGEYCADVQDFINDTNLTNVVLRNLNLTPDATGSVGHGMLFDAVSNSVIDDCTVGLSYACGIDLADSSNDDLVTDNTVDGTVAQHGIAVVNSTADQILGNTVTAAKFDGIILRTTTDSVVSDNNISGQGTDGITLTNDADDDVVELNTIVSSQWKDGGTIGAGIWLNNESDHDTVYANSVTGQPECGIDLFVSSDDTITGNDVFGNLEGGIFLYDDPGDPEASGNPPANNVVTDNYIHDNPTNSGVILRGDANTDVEGNVIVGTFAGTYGSSTDGGLEVQRSTGTKFVGNTMMDLQTGVNLYATANGVEVEQNRFISCGENYIWSGAVVTLDGGSAVGGNYWSNATPGTPFTNFVYNTAGQRGGGYVDNYPFATESLGQSYTATVTSPAAGTTVATGSRRAIQWTSTGAAEVNIYYSSSETGDVLIAADQADNGVYAWTVPSLLAGSDYTIKVAPLDSTGTAHGTPAVSGAFTASATGNLVLLSPSDDMTAAPGGSVVVAWAAQTAGTAVNVQVQEDGGGWTTLAAGVTDDHAVVTLPATAAAAARIRIVDAVTGTGDTQDGSFRMSGTPVVNALASSVAVGADPTISWTSPAGSETVGVQFFNGTAWTTIATATPDLGHVNWLVPAEPTTAATVKVSYYDGSGNPLGTATSNAFAIVGPAAMTTPTPTPTPSPTPTPTPTPTVTPTAVTVQQGAPVVVNVATAFPGAAAPSTKAAQKIGYQVLNAAGAAVLAGSVKVANGNATVVTSKIHQAGTYTLVLTNAAGTTARQTLTVLPSAAVKVAFTTLPTNVNGSSAVSVQLLDRYGNVTTMSDGSTVSLSLTKSTFGKQAALAGTTTATIVHGVATFANLSVTGATAGTGHLTATSGKLKSPVSATFGIA